MLPHLPGLKEHKEQSFQPFIGDHVIDQQTPSHDRKFLSIDHTFTFSYTMASAILVNGSDQVIIRDNVVVMDIENLLTGWPTYEIEFTPENPGPLVCNLDLFILLTDIDLETNHPPQRSCQDGAHRGFY
jgi:hypothetical protein